MKNPREARRLRATTLVPVLALAASAAFATSASAQQVGPYDVTASVVQDTVANTTTATYTVTAPTGGGTQDISHVDDAVASCWDGSNLTISSPGAYSATGDPSANLTNSIIKWDKSQSVGTTKVYSYTVSGIYAASLQTFTIKSGSNFPISQADLPGISCDPPAAPGTPPVDQGPPAADGPSNPAGPVGPANTPASTGDQGVLGVTVKACIDRRKFTFKLHHAPGQPIVKVKVFVNGKKKMQAHGKNIRTATIRKLPKGKFVVKIVATQKSGSTLTSVRHYKGCKKGKPRTTAQHAH